MFSWWYLFGMHLYTGVRCLEYIEIIEYNILYYTIQNTKSTTL